MLIKYYSTQRPVGIGTYPDNSNFCEFENYGCKNILRKLGVEHGDIFFTVSR